MTVSMIVTCPYSIAAMIPTFLLTGYYMVRVSALKRIGSESLNLQNVCIDRKIELHCMNCGTNYDQRPCATCGSVTTRLVREKENGFPFIFFHFPIFASACQKNVQNYYILYIIGTD